MTSYSTLKVREWRLNPENRKKEVEWNRRYRLQNREKTKISGKRSFLKRKYGMSESQLNELLSKQKNRCLVCKRELPIGLFGSIKRTIDHCHRTGKVRGILCNKCKIGRASCRERV